MYKLAVVLLLLIHSLAAEEYQMSLHDPESTAKRQIQLQIDIRTEEMEGISLDQKSIYTDIETRLQLAQISIVQDSTLPQLILRIKSIPIGTTACATFLQLTFLEEAFLKRNQTPLMAVTWSRGLLLAAEKDQYASEILSTTSSMINAFILDYQKAFSKQPASKPPIQQK